MMQFPRVFHLISSSAYLGAESVVMELARTSCSKHEWVRIGVIENSRRPSSELADAALKDNIPVNVFKCTGRFDWRTCGETRNIFRIEQPNIIHSHNYKSNFFAFAAKSRVPWIVTNHLWKRTTLSLRLYTLLDVFVISFADAVVAVSKEIADEMRRYGIPEKKISVIDNGIDLKRFATVNNSEALRQSLGITNHDLVVGTVASLTVEKGHALLLDAVAGLVCRFPQLRLLFVGDGPERAELVRKAEGLGIRNKVVFAGRRSDIPELLGIMDVFVLPSYKEGLPMALLEALAARVPSVATAVGAVPEVIADGETGIVVSPGSVYELSAALERMFNDQVESRLMGQRGSERVKGAFSSVRMADDYWKLYENLIGVSRGRT